MKKKLVVCTGVKRGKCKNKKCDHYKPHRPVTGPAYHGPGHTMRKLPLEELEQFKISTIYCTRFGFCRYYKETRDKRPVAWPRVIEVKCE